MIQFLSNPADFQALEQAYLALRAREGRVLSDEAVCQLPFRPPHPEVAREWIWRRRTFERFRRYLVRRYGAAPVTILDLGCGNGWLANQLAMRQQWDIWAVDVNLPELAQGDRLFARENLRFVLADVCAGVLPEQTFDVVVLAASAQYFPDMAVLLAALRRILKPGGEIHFLDTPFYTDATAQRAAQARTALYYEKMCAPDMIPFYHHHCRPEGSQRMDAPIAVLLQKIGYLGPFDWLWVQ
jgi:ubiquinone/menaquinone biosynthesis C-methylase UbiE